MRQRTCEARLCASSERQEVVPPTGDGGAPPPYGAFLLRREDRGFGSRSNRRTFAQMALPYRGSTADGSFKS